MLGFNNFVIEAKKAYTRRIDKQIDSRDPENEQLEFMLFATFTYTSLFNTLKHIQVNSNVVSHSDEKGMMIERRKRLDY